MSRDRDAPGQESIGANGSAVLGSWKEIAAYLGKGVRTVQRWERGLGLPVRRPVAHNRRIVVAVPAEIDAWIHGQMSRTAMAKDRMPAGPRSESRAYRVKLGALRAELARQREVLRREVGSLRSRLQRLQ